VQSECATETADIEREIAHFMSRKEMLQMRVTQSLSEKGWVQNEASLRLKEFKRLQEGLKQVGQECADSLRTYDNEMCTLKRTKRGIFVSNGIELSQEVTADCQVSPWTPAEACSMTCGGGHQQFVRTVVVPAGSKGMPCPALTANRPCNVQPCPVDCEVTEWSEWSQCSALCGGGSRSRSRQVLKMAKHGGNPCPDENSFAESCNPQPCEHECKLGLWSSYSQCSRSCNGGLQRRKRAILEDASQGAAQCPSDDQRSEYLHCNSKSCPAGPLKCASAVDLVLVVDGVAPQATRPRPHCVRFRRHSPMRCS